MLGPKKWHLLENGVRAPWRLSRLRSWCCHCCVAGPILSPGTFTGRGHSRKTKNKKTDSTQGDGGCSKRSRRGCVLDPSSLSVPLKDNRVFKAKLGTMCQRASNTRGSKISGDNKQYTYNNNKLLIHATIHLRKLCGVEKDLN